MDNIKYFISGIFTGLALFFIMKVGSCNQELPNQKVVESLTKKVDSLIFINDSLRSRYKDSKKVIYLRDSIYLNDRTLENCDSLVEVQRIALKNCDTVINVSDTIIQTMVLRDSFRVETIEYLKNNKRKFKLGGFAGGGYNPINQSVNPVIGFGIVF
jgi:hypothetical protein